jgi:hypothetical protein
MPLADGARYIVGATTLANDPVDPVLEDLISLFAVRTRASRK